MSIEKFLQAYPLIMLYVTASSLTQMFAQLLFLCNSSQCEVAWRLHAMHETTCMYVQTFCGRAAPLCYHLHQFSMCQTHEQRHLFIYFIRAKSLHCVAVTCQVLSRTTVYNTHEKNTAEPFPYYIQSLWEAFTLLSF